MSSISEVIDHLESVAPTQYQMSYDNSQLLVGDRHATVTGVLTTLDCLESTIDEAVQNNCNLVVAHHPIIFSGLKQLVGQSYIERTIIKAIKNDVAIYAIHTNLDSILDQGVNTEIAHRIGLHDTSILSPDIRHDSEGNVGAGLVGNLATEMSTHDFLDHLKDKMSCNVIKHTAITTDRIKRVAVCGGAGGFLLQAAKESDADIFVTSDYKYHEFFDADGDLIIADIGHYESEQFTIDLLHRIVSQKFNTFAAHKTKLITNPVNYFY